MYCLEVIKKMNNEAQAEYDKKVKARMREVDKILQMHRGLCTVPEQREKFLDLIKSIIAND